jgi:hypothetical protein
MGLYAAGKALDRPEWCRQAADVLMKVVAEQSAAGYWSEGGGPVVLYDFVYVDALGVYYDRTGLILGGGNTKLQPAWSNFTVGDAALLAHRPGDDNPHFLPQGRLYHVPSAAELVRQPELGLNLTYGPERCRIRILPKDDRTLQYRLQTTGESGLPVAAHLTLMPHFGRPLETAAGQKFVLGDAPIELGSDQIGGWISHAGCRLRLPAMASLHWPRLPHNPYAKDGRCSPQDGRIEIAIPLNPGHPECEITLEILP